MKSVFGLSENTAAALSYVLGPISGIIMLVLERESKFVRFHALQSTLWFLFLWILRWVIGFIVSVFSAIPFIGTPLGWILGVIVWPVMLIWGLVLIGSKLFLMFKASSGAEFRIPLMGDVVWNQIYK